jgi:hypothetical protein
MNERYFWWLLQVRVSDELAEMADRSLRPFWCDGFTPTTYTSAGFEITVCDLKRTASRSVSWNMKSAGKRSAFRFTAWTSAFVDTP